MQTHHGSSLETRVADLERSLRNTRICGAGLLVALLTTAFTASPRVTPAASEILRTRGLVIEDEQGRARILLGAPVPSVTERKRRDPATGLVLLGEGGTDRLQLGNVGGPQMGGTVQARISPATGLQVNDTRGDERGGFGLLDNGRIALGLDDPHGEGVMLVVAPDLGINGLIVNGVTGNDTQERARLVTTKDGVTELAITGGSGKKRVALRVEKESVQLPAFDDQGEVQRDLFGE